MITPASIPTILLVDDNPTNLKVLSEAIATSGWEILVATDGETAIEQAEYSHPDLIFLDVMMPPGIDGFETCQRLKQNPQTSHIPIIFMTALDDTLDKVKGLSLGAVDYITKPFRTEEVLARAKVHLQIYYLTKELASKNEELEEKVSERTHELSQAIETLQKSQLQLVQSEKMSALGQLVAGVAHEINNPVGFIAGNLNHASGYLEDLVEHLHLYQAQCPEGSAAIAEHSEEIDLEYLLEDFPKLIASMREGTDRIKDISTSLRTFSRSDSTEKAEFDLHEGIDSTILILKYRIKGNEDRKAIEVVREYAKLPSIPCYPGQLNQVFMNILANAIDALDDCSKDSKERVNQVTIRTELVDAGTVAVRIRDNALGIPPEVQARIFEHLFTTKPVGKGTGLGLSIARQIVEEKHNGKIRCCSELGQGTEFIIELPVNG
jgi:signal transduction histidine kinase